MVRAAPSIACHDSSQSGRLVVLYMPSLKAVLEATTMPDVCRRVETRAVRSNGNGDTELLPRRVNGSACLKVRYGKLPFLVQYSTLRT